MPRPNDTATSPTKFWSWAVVIVCAFGAFAMASSGTQENIGWVVLGVIFYGFIIGSFVCTIIYVLAFAVGLLRLIFGAPSAAKRGHAQYRQAKHERNVEATAQGIERAYERNRRRN